MKLYKKDSKGKIRELNVYADNGRVVQISGLLDGKKVTHIKEVQPKNIGKKNQTTAIVQAVAEANSIKVKKIKKGYFSTIEDAENIDIILPMLAKSEKEHKHKIEWPCYGQPKLDGMRLLAKGIQKLSRENTPIVTLDHINLGGIDVYIDGEAYAHGHTFQENMKLIKKYRKDETENVKYHVYDMISDKSFIDRYNDLKELLKTNKTENICLVETIILNNQEELDDYHSRNLEAGFEGTMIRWGDSGYKVNGRSDSLLKYKDFKDIALPIVDIIESDRVPGQGIVVIEYNGHTSKTGSKLSHADRADLLINKDDYIGKTAEIRYFEETDKGALRFPVFYGVRIDK